MANVTTPETSTGETDTPVPGNSRSGCNRIGLAALVGFGGAVIALFFGGLGYWAWHAELASAAVAPGQIAPDSSRKTVQHLEGGIVEAIHVAEGDSVEAGQLLLSLDKTATRAELKRVQAALYGHLALKARLIAERNRADAIVFPPILADRAGDPAVAPVMASQRGVFEARRVSYEAQTAILFQRIAQKEEEIKGLKGQIEAAMAQTGFLELEIADMEGLLKKGLVERPRVYSLKRRRAEIAGETARARAGIARAHQAIGEAQVQMIEIKTRMVGQSVEQLQEVESRILDLNQQLSAARDVLRRTEIKAPRAGRVVDTQVHTVGGVVRAGDPILDIVPREDRLLVTARIDPSDIDVVRPGQGAEIRLSAYQQRHFKPLQGRLLWVSGDAMSDEKTHEKYYLGRIEITEPIENALPGAKLYPGMQADTVILTGSSTLLDWLLRPVQQTLNRGLREK